jgi:hypothetical protein
MSATRSNAVEECSLAERLRAYGCIDPIPLDKDHKTPEQIEYLDLLSQQTAAAKQPKVDAVVEHQGAALLYVVDGCDNSNNSGAALTSLQHLLANRSDPAWLGVARPGSLEIHPIGFHETRSTVPLRTIHGSDTYAPMFFQSLVHGTFAENDRLHGSDYVFRKIFELLTQTIDAYVPDKKLEPLDVLSMAGRALFIRFLIDREIVLPNEKKTICPSADALKDTFENAEKAAQTSAWLDSTFNGDFLYLIDESIPADNRAAREEAYSQFYQRVERSAGKGFFRHLHAILNGWRATGENVQPEFDWGDLDFAHIPVGVLSQVYESFSHRADARTARSRSVHYTPRTIARLMIDQTFAAAKNPARAKVLDPACGAGIFLVLAFRRLVRERWLLDEQRPDTKVIQNILYGQLRGFDVSESALRLAALALYITAIEVNGTQRPPAALKFPRNLRNEVLYYFGDDTQPRDSKQKAAKPTFTLGSLGPKVPSHFNKTFDIVIGNPPWTRLREDQPESTEEKAAARAVEQSSVMAETDVLNQQFTEIGQRALRARGLDDLAEHYGNPDKNPDLSFVWCSMEWAKDGGLLTFVLPARIFGRTTGTGFQAWKSVLRCVSITGLINGADLRWSKVWEDIKVPFCFFFARNSVPAKDHRFYYATPVNEPDQNRHARFRIDYETTQPISVARLEWQPWVLKTLSLGTWRDVELMEVLLKAFPRTLAEEWKFWDPSEEKTGQGYNRSPRLKQQPAAFLGKLKDFIHPKDNFSIPFDELDTYLDNYGKTGKDGKRYATAARPRSEVLYQPPLVVIPQSPGKEADLARAYFSNKPLAFSQSFYGYSCKGHPEADTLASLLYLLPHSRLFSYFCLLTSRRAGFDRLTFNKEEFDAIPFPTVSDLPAETRAILRDLAHRLRHEARKPWDEIDSFLFRLYGLDDDAVQVAKDTLFSAMPYRKRGAAALERTRRETREPFRVALQETLAPFFEISGEHVAVAEPGSQPDMWDQPWFFLAISRLGESVPVNAALLRRAMEEANKRGASRIIVKAHGRAGLLLGLLNQRRWWTVTRAQLCGQHILRKHLGAFGLGEHS